MQISVGNRKFVPCAKQIRSPESMFSIEECVFTPAINITICGLLIVWLMPHATALNRSYTKQEISRTYGTERFNHLPCTVALLPIFSRMCRRASCTHFWPGPTLQHARAISSSVIGQENGSWTSSVRNLSMLLLLPRAEDQTYSHIMAKYGFLPHSSTGKLFFGTQISCLIVSLSCYRGF
jgi:hypothetical protein